MAICFVRQIAGMPGERLESGVTMTDTAPDSVELCQNAIRRMGLRLERVDSPSVIFHLVDPGASPRDPPAIIETFHSESWTDIECAQAALRFARYFLSDKDTSGA